MFLTYRFRIYPNAHQATVLNEKFGLARTVYNTLVEWGQSEKTDIIRNHHQACTQPYESQAISDHPQLPPTSQPCDHLVDHFLAREHNHDLTDRSILINTVRLFAQNRQIASRNHCQLNYKRKAYAKQSISFLARHQKMQFTHNTIQLAYLGTIRASFTRKLIGRIISLTFCKTATDRYYACLVAKKADSKRTVSKTLQKKKIHIVGIDVGIEHYITLSDGTQHANPEFQDKAQQKLKRGHRKLNRKKEGSRNYEKQRLVLAKKYEHIHNSRRGFLHTLSTELVRKYDVIAIESLDVKQLMHQSPRARKIADASWRQFLWMLQYKAKWQGKLVIEVPRYLPSTKQCCRCRYINNKLTLRDRTWTCPSCQTPHDRDVNASVNILIAATHILLREWPSINRSSLIPVLSEKR